MNEAKKAWTAARARVEQATKHTENRESSKSRLQSQPVPTQGVFVPAEAPERAGSSGCVSPPKLCRMATTDERQESQEASSRLSLATGLRRNLCLSAGFGREFTVVCRRLLPPCLHMRRIMQVHLPPRNCLCKYKQATASEPGMPSATHVCSGTYVPGNRGSSWVMCSCDVMPRRTVRSFTLLGHSKHEQQRKVSAACWSRRVRVSAAVLVKSS